MLEELHVRDLALIEDVWLEFGPGMTVLSGETGAGKTALLGALKLLVGERADSSLVRAGASETLVEGRVRRRGTECVAKRRVSADGRSRCHLDGEMATVGQLAEALGPLFDLHGQHEHQALLSPAHHVGYLDRYVGEEAARARSTYLEAFEHCREAREDLTRLEEQLAEDERRADYLRFVLNEVEAAALVEGEDEELERRMPMLRHGEKLAVAASEAYASLHDDGGASDSASSALAALGRLQGLDPALDTLAERLSETVAILDDLGLELREYGAGIEYDPSALNEAENRMAVLQGLKKKYGPEMTDVLRTREEARLALEGLDEGESRLKQARERVEAASATLASAGQTLVRIRTEAAEAFVDALQASVEDLALPYARFEVAFTELELEDWTAEGPHRVEFLYAPAPDQPFRPLSKIASGGELSRVMLALKGVLGAADRVPVLVFDEIDAGIGGAAATSVGRRLSALAETHQVLVITHLAQVAAFADRHLVVEKRVEEGSVRTSVLAVTGEERVAEISRMLAGGDTAAGRTHAEELLDSAASA